MKFELYVDKVDRDAPAGAMWSMEDEWIASAYCDGEIVNTAPGMQPGEAIGMLVPSIERVVQRSHEVRERLREGQPGSRLR